MFTARRRQIKMMMMRETWEWKTKTIKFNCTMNDEGETCL